VVLYSLSFPCSLFLFTVHHWLFSEAWKILLVWKPRGLSGTVTEDSDVLSVSKFYLTFRHHASYIQDRRTATLQSTLFIYLVNKYI